MEDHTPGEPEGRTAKPTADLDNFEALDLRIGYVTDAEEFPEARVPAYRLTVDFGPVIGKLQTSAQITANYDPHKLVDRLVIGVVNLPSKNVAGFESEFLVLGGISPEGLVHLLDVDGELPPGSVVA